MLHPVCITSELYVSDDGGKDKWEKRGTGTILISIILKLCGFCRVSLD